MCAHCSFRHLCFCFENVDILFIYYIQSYFLPERRSFQPYITRDPKKLPLALKTFETEQWRLQPDKINVYTSHGTHSFGLPENLDWKWYTHPRNRVCIIDCEGGAEDDMWRPQNLNLEHDGCEGPTYSMSSGGSGMFFYTCKWEICGTNTKFTHSFLWPNPPDCLCFTPALHHRIRYIDIAQLGTWWCSITIKLRILIISHT